MHSVLSGAPAHKLAFAHLIDHFSLVPVFVRVKLDPRCRGEHGCGKVLSEIRSLLVSLAKTMVFADITVLLPVFRPCKTYGCKNQAVWFLSRLAGKNNEGDLPCFEFLDPLGLRDNLTFRR